MFYRLTVKLPPMTCSFLILNWLLVSISENVPHLWTFSSKEVNHIKNGMIMWNMMKCFMYEVKRVDIAKVCWKSKMKDWDYMKKINVWDHVQNDFNKNTWLITNIKKKPHGYHFTIACHLQTSFIIQIMHSQNKKIKIIVNNHSQ